MAGCIPNSLFLSEVLVILSSCVFVVMALLTAVVSVTSITFIDKNELKTEHHCHLPNRFSVKSNFDLPSYSTLFSQFFTRMIVGTNSVINSFRFLILSSLRDSLIESEIISNNRYLNIFSDNLIQIIERSLKIHKIDYNISNIPLYAIHTLISQSENIQYHTFSEHNNRSFDGKFTFNVSSPSFLFDIEAIKSTLVNRSKPLSLSIPFDLISFLQNEKKDLSFEEYLDSNLLSKYTYIYIVYGWNDDFMLKIPSSTNKGPLIGGFIVRQFLQENEGHSISYFYGNLTEYEEKTICPQLSNNLQFLNLHNKIQLSCTNYKKCNTHSNYILEPSNIPQNFNTNNKDESTTNIEFLEISEKEIPTKVTICFDNINDFAHSFSIKSELISDQCNYFFLPYEILTKAFAYSQTVEQLTYGISSSFYWTIPENIDLSNFVLKFSDRPTPLFEI